MERQTKKWCKRFYLDSKFFGSLFSQIKSDDIPSEVKLSDVNNTDINPYITLCCCNSCGEILKKPIKVVKCEHRFCLNCLAACLSGKYEEEPQCPVCKINILKADIIPSSDLQSLLSLLKIQCKRCSKKFLIITHYNHYTKHMQNCSLDISPPSSLLVSDVFNVSNNDISRSVEDATLHVLKKKMKLNPGNSLIEFKTGGRVCISLLLCCGSINWLQIPKLHILVVHKQRAKDRFQTKEIFQMFIFEFLWITLYCWRTFILKRFQSQIFFPFVLLKAYCKEPKS